MRNNSLSYLNDFPRATLGLLSYNIMLKSQATSLLYSISPIGLFPRCRLKPSPTLLIGAKLVCPSFLFSLHNQLLSVSCTLCSSLGSPTGPGTTNAYLPSILTLAVHLSLGYFFCRYLCDFNWHLFQIFFFSYKKLIITFIMWPFQGEIPNTAPSSWCVFSLLSFVSS